MENNPSKSDSLPVDTHQSEINNKAPSSAAKYIYISLILILGVAVAFLAWQNSQLRELQRKQNNPIPSTTIVPNDNSNQVIPPPSQPDSSGISTADTWVSTDIAGFTFKYPKGWQVATANTDNIASNLIFISPEPIQTETTHGPNSMLIMTMTNDFKDPEQEYKDMIQKDVDMLENIKQEKLSSKYYSEIIHVTGTYSGDGFMGGTKFEKYYFLNTDPKYVDLKDTTNRNILTVELNPNYPLFDNISDQNKEIVKKIILSIKECDFSTCENE